MRHFVEELEQLKTKLLEMSSLVESAIQRSISAVIQKDRSAAEEVFRNEARINAIEIEIDEFAINLLALQQPMAADLRLIVAALKINTDLERMGDLSVNIAQRATSLMEEPVIKPMIDIPHIAGLVQSMVRKSAGCVRHSRCGPGAQRARLRRRGRQPAHRLLSRAGQLHGKDPQNIKRRWICWRSPATWSASPTIPPTSPRTCCSW